jgi:site-specific recombinase XerD
MNAGTAIVTVEPEIVPAEIILAGSPLPSWATNNEPDSRAPFADLYSSHMGGHTRALWQGAWEEAQERWLTSGRRRSEHTRRTYRFAVMQFRQYTLEQLGVMHLWQITDYHVQQYINHLTQQGMAKRTIAARLAACSSFYDYCIGTAAMLNGREISLFIDAYGSSRQNPFTARTIARPKVEQFSDAQQVPPDAYRWIITDLQERNTERPCSENLRNLALMLTFGLNGWRNEEVLSMTWGKVSENHQHVGQFTYRWTGKARDGAEERRPLPAATYHAIVAYLKFEGRWNPGGPGHIADDEYIWQPLRTAGCANFGNVEKLAANRHITQSTANGILQSLLRRYYITVARKSGLDKAAARDWASAKAQQYSIHSLRHMFAWELYEASGHNIHMVSTKLGHKSIATTQIYLQHLKEPVDDHSDLLARQLGLTF